MHVILDGLLRKMQSTGNLLVGPSLKVRLLSTEQLNPMEDALKEYLEANRRIIAQQRLFKAQLLASYLYEQAISDAALRALFISDDRITESAVPATSLTEKDSRQPCVTGNYLMIPRTFFGKRPTSSLSFAMPKLSPISDAGFPASKCKDLPN
jgi:hypothetical protein